MNARVLRASAYAKINLSLSVTGVRADGMHTLRTVMQTVSLCDTVEASRADGLTFSCSVPSLAGETNLCVRAAKAFFGETRLSPGVSLRLEKRIPTGAGLGGGSADAAAVLRLLNRLYGEPLPEDALYPLAAGLGADVPFCLRGGKCLCTGVGEELTPLPDGETLYLVVAKGQGSLSTAEMYRRLDEDFAENHAETDAPNQFEPVAEALLPEIRAVREALRSVGGEGARMTGSGSALFAFFPTERAAESAAQTLQTEHNVFAEACRTVSRAEMRAEIPPENLSVSD